MQKLINFLQRLFITLIYRFRSNRLVVTHAVLSGRGSFVDIRYWLSRPDKVGPPTKIYLIHEETGVHLEAMKLARIRPLQTNHAYMTQTGSALFRNRDGLVKPGTRVSLVLGNLRTDNIEVS